MKVETTGDFMLVDIHGGQTIDHKGVTEVEETAFVAACLEDGRLRNVDAPAEETTDNSPPTSGRQAKTTKKAD